MNERTTNWKYKEGDTVKGGGCFDDHFTIYHRVAEISNGQRFYIVGSMEGQQTKCAHEFEERTELVIPND